MKKFVLPVGAGVVVFGVVTAFAASLNVTSSSLAAGNGTVGACNSSANLTNYTTAPITSGANKGKYAVTGATLTTVAGTPSSCGGMSFKVQLLDGSNVVVGTEATGTLGANTGSAAVDFSGTEVLASNVSNLAVVITG